MAGVSPTYFYLTINVFQEIVSYKFKQYWTNSIPKNWKEQMQIISRGKHIYPKPQEILINIIIFFNEQHTIKDN